MSERWLMNEDIYLIHWGINGNIESRLLSYDLGRSQKAVTRRLKYLQSAKGQLRRRIAEQVHGKCQVLAREMLALEDMGFDLDAWLDGNFPVNDFNAAAMPEYFGSASAKDNAA